MDLFEIPELDYQQTRLRVNLVMKRYELALMRIESKVHPKITQTFTLEMTNFNGGKHSSTEEAALYEVEGKCKDRKFVQEVTDVINRMNVEYREIFSLSYIENLTNGEIARKMNMSESSLNLKKRIAIELFAYGMGIEVYFRK